jgi:hypothetical protein
MQTLGSPFALSSPGRHLPEKHALLSRNSYHARQRRSDTRQPSWYIVEEVTGYFGTSSPRCHSLREAKLGEANLFNYRQAMSVTTKIPFGNDS